MNLKSAACVLALSAAPILAFAQSPAPQAAAPQAPALPSVQLPPEAERILRDYEKHWSANNPAAVAALFAADGMALPNGQMPAQGAAQITAAYARNAGGPLALRAIAYSESKDMAYIVGGFAQQAGQPDGGKFIIVLKRGADGKWQIAADMDNMNSMPRRAPKPQ
ncbi:YybH family protein [Pseudoduganella sp. GCM10020061]|uniref:YybH family protein n=1 Tax=Pseudoduganella sp. GCM10020061 TaxID=3317345 RepID=UPI003634DB69